MKFRINRPTLKDKKTGLYHQKVYRLIGGNSAHKLAKAEAIKFGINVYMHNSKTDKLMYIYTPTGEKQDYTTAFWRRAFSY